MCGGGDGERERTGGDGEEKERGRGKTGRRQRNSLKKKIEKVWKRYLLNVCGIALS